MGWATGRYPSPYLKHMDCFLRSRDGDDALAAFLLRSVDYLHLESRSLFLQDFRVHKSAIASQAVSGSDAMRLCRVI